MQRPREHEHPLLCASPPTPRQHRSPEPPLKAELPAGVCGRKLSGESFPLEIRCQTKAFHPKQLLKRPEKEGRFLRAALLRCCSAPQALCNPAGWRCWGPWVPPGANGFVPPPQHSVFGCDCLSVCFWPTGAVVTLDFTPDFDLQKYQDRVVQAWLSLVRPNVAWCLGPHHLGGFSSQIRPLRCATLPWGLH